MRKWRPRIFAVDDQPEFEMIFWHIFSRDFRLIFTSSLDECKRAAEGNCAIDLLITDFHLNPLQDGLDVLNCFRKRRPTLPALLFSSADPTHPRILRFLESRSTAFLSKPSSINELRAIALSMTGQTEAGVVPPPTFEKRSLRDGRTLRLADI